MELRLKELSAFLTACGYSEGLIAKQFDCVRQKSREALLNSTRKRAPVADHEQTTTPLVCKWSSLLPPLLPLLKSAFPILGASERRSSSISRSWRTSAQRTSEIFWYTHGHLDQPVTRTLLMAHVSVARHGARHVPWFKTSRK